MNEAGWFLLVRAGDDREAGAEEGVCEAEEGEGSEEEEEEAVASDAGEEEADEGDAGGGGEEEALGEAGGAVEFGLLCAVCEDSCEDDDCVVAAAGSEGGAGEMGGLMGGLLSVAVCFSLCSMSSLLIDVAPSLFLSASTSSPMGFFRSPATTSSLPRTPRLPVWLSAL